MHRPHRGYGETWAKTILMGEHSVVYGRPAVAVPIHSLTMRAWAMPALPGHAATLRSLGYYGPIDQAPEQFGGLRKAIEVTKAYAGASACEFDVVTRSDFPAGRGLGSSAAASGAVVRAILHACGIRADHRDLVALTNRAEVITHGHPSGLDAVTTCGNDPVLFVKGTMTPIDVRMPAYLVIADSGIAGSTKEAVDDVRRQYECDTPRVEAILERLGVLASQSARDLAEGRLNALGRRMDGAHELLNELNISHPVANDLVERARRSGALGAKMTGGGLGGCIIALAADGVSARGIKRDLLAGGAPAVWIHALNQLDIEVDGGVARDARHEADAIDAAEAGFENDRDAAGDDIDSSRGWFRV